MSDLAEKIKSLINDFDEGALKELEELVSAVERKKKRNEGGGYWEPDVGEYYYYIDDDLEVLKDFWQDTWHEMILADSHSIFRTQEQAEESLKLLKKSAKFNNLLITFGASSDFVRGRDNHSILYDMSCGYWTYSCGTYSHSLESLYFKDFNDSDKAIKYLNENYPTGEVK